MSALAQGDPAASWHRRLLKMSARWLADQCRAEKVEHVHLARQRRFTPAQIQALVARRTVRPVADLKLDATRQRLLRLIERKQAKQAPCSSGALQLRYVLL